MHEWSKVTLNILLLQETSSGIFNGKFVNLLMRSITLQKFLNQKKSNDGILSFHRIYPYSSLTGLYFFNGVEISAVARRFIMIR